MTTVVAFFCDVFLNWFIMIFDIVQESTSFEVDRVAIFLLHGDHTDDIIHNSHVYHSIHLVYEWLYTCC